jgi:hypothetical protein
MTKGGAWVTAPFKSYGKQPLYKLTLQKGKSNIKEILCTSDHKWYLSKKSRKFKDGEKRSNKYKISKKISTVELKEGDKLHSQFGKGRSSFKLSPFGIAHGISYGDGHTVKNEDCSNSMPLCGDSRELKKYFINEPTSIDNQACEGGNSLYRRNA